MVAFLLCITPASAEQPTDAKAKQTEEWPLYRGTPLQAGVSAAKLPAKLDVRWQVELKDAIAGGVVIADGVVYAATEDGALHAHDLANGNKKWEFREKDDFFFSPPTIIGNRVYVGGENGTLFAINRDSGKPDWKFETVGAIYSGVNYYQSPADNKLRLLFGSYDGSLYCLDDAGKELWKYTADERVHGTPAIIDGAATFAGCDGKLHLIDIVSGKELSSVELGSPSTSAAASDGKRIFAGTYGDRACGVDILRDASATDKSRAMSLKGAWVFSPAERPGPFMSSASVKDDLVILGSRDKRIWALDATTGKPKWNYQTRGRCEVGGVIVGDRYFVGSKDGTFYALSLADGKPVWQYETGSDITTSPGVVDGHILIGNASGRLICFGEKPGDS